MYPLIAPLEASPSLPSLKNRSDSLSVFDQAALKKSERRFPTAAPRKRPCVVLPHSNSNCASAMNVAAALRDSGPVELLALDGLDAHERLERADLVVVCAETPDQLPRMEEFLHQMSEMCGKQLPALVLAPFLQSGSIGVIKRDGIFYLPWPSSNRGVRTCLKRCFGEDWAA